MSDTTFTNGVTLTDADWFNDVNRLHYTIFGDPTNTISAAAAIGLDFTNIRAGGTLSVSAGAVFGDVVAVSGNLSISAVSGVAIATQTQMESASSTSTIVTPGRLHFHPAAAKAWVKFNGGATSVTAGAAYNITSITDNGVGLYTVNFTTAFSSSTYCAVGTPFNNGGTNNVVQVGLSISAASLNVVCVNWAEANLDLAHVAVACWGDL